MIYTKPYFYDDFICKADKCEDTCCAGWEVDIDCDTCDKYRNIGGDFGKRLLEGIDLNSEQPCFRLKENERCFFLAQNGLCDIYSELGEDALCDICREHPRFYDFFDGITEMGLGLCCEKVCEMVFASNKPITFESYEEGSDCTDEEDNIYFAIREKCFDIIANREKTISARISELLEYAVAVQNEIFADDYELKSDIDKKSLLQSVVDMFAETDPINDEWKTYISEMRESFNPIFSAGENFNFSDAEYEQILTYIMYRHFMQSRFTGEILSAVCFSVVSLIFIYLSDCKTFYVKSAFEKEDRINNVKLWSKQTEYSEENTQYIFDKAFDLFYL